MGVQALGMGLGTLFHELGVKPEIVTGARLPRLFGRGEDGAGVWPDGGGLQGPRHRPRGHADGLFRPVRSRRAVRRHGDGLAQRQRLDRREDGRQPAAHLRAGRDDAAQGHRAQRALRPARRRRLCVRGEFPRPLHRRSHQPAEARAPPQGGLRLRQRHRRRLRTQGARSGRLRGGAARLRPRPHLPALQSQPRGHEDAARDARRGVAHQGAMSPSASMAMATAAASSTTRARRSSPTRSA